jgi:hypothetical protein
MTVSTKRNQVLRYIMTELTPRLYMMDFQHFCRAAVLNSINSLKRCISHRQFEDSRELAVPTTSSAALPSDKHEGIHLLKNYPGRRIIISNCPIHKTNRSVSR